MYRNIKVLLLLIMFSAVAYPAGAGIRENTKMTFPRGEFTGEVRAVLWQPPSNISSRNLFYGSGGERNLPQPSFRFLKEDLHGTNPKIDVVDRDGVKWKVKMGVEARPEVVASRFLWAVGYPTLEYYFLPAIQVKGLPHHLTRGQKMVEPDDIIRDVRLKRVPPDEKKIGLWKWRDNPFSGTREFNGLRVLMALINNWDLKDNNNAVYRVKDTRGSAGQELIYRVTDLGGSFGTTGLSWTHAKSKGNLKSYSHSKFISDVSGDDVDFNVPTRPAIIFLFTPHDFFSRLRLRWIGKRIPRADARWMGQLLARLTPDQIHDAFRAAGYSPRQVNAFSAVVEFRIDQLNRL